MARVALIVHPERPAALAGARQAAAWLGDRGHEVRLSQEDAAAVGLDGSDGDPAQWLDGVDLALVLGGDGTILRAVDLVSSRGVPILGVNLGRLGFLTAVEPGGLDAALERMIAGDFLLEERMLMTVAIEKRDAADGAPDPPDPLCALNEAVVERPSPGHTLNVVVSIRGRTWTTYAADGLIVATPTGSTAYAFSAGGPILSPRLRALQLTPVAPHMPFGRTLVLDPLEPVRIEITSAGAAVLVVDGRDRGRLGPGDAIVCSAADRAARFVTFGQRDFYGVLKAKFRVTDR